MFLLSLARAPAFCLWSALYASRPHHAFPFRAELLRVAYVVFINAVYICIIYTYYSVLCIIHTNAYTKLDLKSLKFNRNALSPEY